MSRTRLFVSLIFFLSGVAGLIYEVVWAKQLSLLFGNTARAHTIVLATFMGGLAAGYACFGKIADKKVNPLYLYAWIEIGIGLLGALSIPFSQWFGSAYFPLASYFGPGSLVTATLKVGFSLLLIFLPTFLMGGTLPVLSCFSVHRLKDVEVAVGWLYFLNSFGAAAGSLLAGFFLIPAYGLNLSVVFAATLNIGVGLVAFALRIMSETGAAEARAGDEKKSPSIAYSRIQVRLMVAGIGLSGTAALFYEVAWIRLLSLVIGSSTYSFSLMLAAFIAGIALGGLAVSCGWVVRMNAFLAFACAELGVALGIVLTLPVYERLPYYFVLLAGLFQRVPENFWLYELAQLFICFALMLVPTFFLGMTLPLASQIASRALQKVGQSVGDVFAANTTGTIIGAATAGLVFLPILGVKGLIEFGVLIHLVIGSVALALEKQTARKVKAAMIGFCVVLFASYLHFYPSWDKSILASGVYRGHRFIGANYGDFKTAPREQILYYRDGANVTVSVSQHRDGELSLKVNGKPDATTRSDLSTQILLAQIPLVLKPDAGAALVIGLGSGITAGSVLSHPVESLDVVEISPEVVEANHFFSDHNRNALKDPRLKLYLDDGKTFLRITRKSYDVIISEPSNPWIAGIGNLFSLQFYQDVRNRLRPGGVMVQWFHTYEMTDDTLRLLLRTFAASFEHVTVWNPKPGDLILLGSQEPLLLDYDQSNARFMQPPVRAELNRLSIASFATLLSLQVAADTGVRRAAGSGKLNEDGFPILEYEAPKAFFLGRPANLLTAYDERILPPVGSPLYLAQYGGERALAAGELRKLTLYHLNQGSVTASGFSRRLLEAWVEHSPQDMQARWMRARVEQLQGNFTAALQDLRVLLEVDPTRPEYLEAAADSHLQLYLNRRSVVTRANPDAALAPLRKLLDLTRDRKAVIYQKMAQVHVAAGETESALRRLKEGAIEATKNRNTLGAQNLWLAAAALAEQTHDIPRAIEFVRAALALNPQNSGAQERLRDLLVTDSRGPLRAHLD